MSIIAEAAGAYLNAWARKDLDGVAAHLHRDVHFKAPMQELAGREQVLAAAARVFSLLERIDTRAKFFSADAAMLCYDFVCREPIGVSRTAEWLRFEGPLIREIELFFDARPFATLQAQRTPAQ